jgi:hypothetical protein
VLCISIFCIANFVTAQENKPTFLEKTHQNSISIELAAISYSYALKFNTNVTLGARVQGGFGLPITLLSTSVLYDDGYGDGPDEVKTRSYPEMLKLQLFYRHSISNSFYFDLGPFGSISPFGETGWEKPLKAGMEASAYYSIRKLHIGLRINGALCFDSDDANILRADDTFYVLDVIPLVVGFNF